MSTLRRYLPLLVSITLLFAFSTTVGAFSIIYEGETPESGNNGDLWDYVYNLSATDSVHGPLQWAIVVPYDPGTDKIHSPDDWLATYHSSLPETFTALNGQPGIAWDWDGNLGAKPSEGPFHFQSKHSPKYQEWQTVDGGTYSDTGTQWSASPEPASMILTAIALFGAAAWRRKQQDN